MLSDSYKDTLLATRIRLNPGCSTCCEKNVTYLPLSCVADSRCLPILLAELRHLILLRASELNRAVCCGVQAVSHLILCEQCCASNVICLLVTANAGRCSVYGVHADEPSNSGV